METKCALFSIVSILLNHYAEIYEASPQKLILKSSSTCSSLFSGNPQDCTSYYHCNHGIPVLRYCTPGLYWNPEITGCDWPRNIKRGTCVPTGTVTGQESLDNNPQPQETAQAGDSNDINSNIEAVIIDASENEDDVQLNDICQSGAFAANGNDCSTFYICNHGDWILQSCGYGLHWNRFINSCDWPAQAKCTTGVPIAPQQTTSVPSVQVISTTTTMKPPQVKPEETTTAETPPVVPSIPWNSNKKLVCYFTDWAWYRPLPSGKYLPENIDPSLCTHIVYSFALLNGNDFVLKPADTWADFDNHFYEKVTSLKSSGTKVTLALGGWNDSGGSKYSQLVNDPSNRARFIKSTIEYLKKYNFDGLDLDWEYPKCWQGNCNRGPDSDKVAFGQLVKELRASLPKSYILSAAVSASKLIIDAGYDVPTLAENLDWIGVMDYDFHGNWDKRTGHIAPLYQYPGDQIYYYNTNFSIHYWIEKGVPREKLVMGIPLYGQSFTLASSSNNGLNAISYGPGEAGPFTRQGGVLAYYEICSQTWTATVQDPQKRIGPYSYRGNQWVSYDDINMVKIKANYIKETGLGGGMIWALDMDDFTNLCKQGPYPLLNAIANTLK